MTTRKTTSSASKTRTRSTSSKAKTAKSASSVRSMPKVASTEKAPVAEPAAAPEQAAAVSAGPAVLRKNEFVERVVAETNMKKRDVRAIAETMFKIMGNALSDGRTVAVDGDFKMRPVKQNPFEDGVVVTTKVRLEGAAAKADKVALAEPAE